MYKFVYELSAINSLLSSLKLHGAYAVHGALHGAYGAYAVVYFHKPYLIWCLAVNFFANEHIMGLAIFSILSL